MTNSEMVTVQRPAVTQSAMGGVIRTWADVSGLTAIRCKFQQNSSFENERQGRTSERMQGTAYFDGELAIQSADRIVFDSQSYEVTGVHAKRLPGGRVLYTAVEWQITDGTKG